MTENKNIIIIGAGIGGISTGAFLSKSGYKVKIFEKNPLVGGYCQTFYRKGYLINPAVLRVGTQDCAKRIDGYCAQLGIAQQQWIPYSEYYYFGKDICVQMDCDNLAVELANYFPDQKESLHDFFQEMAEVFSLINKVMQNDMKLSTLSIFEMKKYIPYLKKKSCDVINSYFHDNVLLCDILLAMMDIDKNSVALSIPITYYALKGNGKSYIMKGGMGNIISEFVELIEKLGGEIICNSKVNKIVTENGKAIGVEVDNTFYGADFIISSIDIRKTYSELVEQSQIQNTKMVSKIFNKWSISKSCFSMWIGLDCSLEELKIPEASVVIYPNPDMIVDVRKAMNTRGGSLPKDFWFQVFSAYSDDVKSTPKGKAQLSVGLVVPYQFENNWGKGINQKEVKDRVKNNLLEAVEKLYPQIKGHYVYVEAATPLTYEKYSANCEGAYLGFEKYEDFIYDKHRHENKGLIENLYLSSQWTSVIGGCSGILQEAIKTANLISSEHPIEDKMQEYDLLI